MSEPMTYIDHAICLSCGAVRDDAIDVVLDNHGMTAGTYPYPVLVPVRYARAITQAARCSACNEVSQFLLALRPMEARS